MAQPRRRKAGRHATSGRGQKGTSAWLWLFIGILIGLGLAYYLFAKGYIPKPDGAVLQPSDGSSAQPSEAGIAEVSEPPEVKPERPRYDFFTVLPEMEVVVPEQELRESSQPSSPTPQQNGEEYLLQVGSFRQANDAEQLKARLALLGMTARVQSVNVNDSTWHRVRIGPVTGARQAEDIRGRLLQNGIDSLVMKNP